MRKREMGQVSWRELRDKKRMDKFMKERKRNVMDTEKPRA